MAEIVVQNVRKEFGDFVAVEESSFTVRDGEFFMLLGPSGCGKTTTLRMIAGLELPTSGVIRLDGEDVTQVPASRRDIAFVFQLFALYPHMNVYRNLAYPLVSQGKSRAEVRKKIAEVAEILRISHLLKSSVGRLSGGDRQRVALGRAIVREPKAFLMDEPLGALDAEFRERMAEELRALHERMEATTVYVTHDQLEAMQMGDRIVVMNHGVVEQAGTPREIYENPNSMFVADFIGSPPMNFVEFEGSIAPNKATVTVPGGDVPILPERFQPTGGRLALGVRPEDIRLGAPGGDGLPAQVEASEYLGTTQVLTLDIPNGRLKARVPSAQRVRPGENVALTFVTERLSMFDAASGRSIARAMNDGERDG